MTGTRREIEELVRVQLGVANVCAADLLVEDLGAESADVLNLVVALEDRYGITIDEGEIPDLRTVADFSDLVCKRS